MQVEKRAERVDEAQLQQTFVDTGAIFASLLSTSNQIIYGRRGTGKTHALRYLGATVQQPRVRTVYLSLDQLGSTAGLYADPGSDVAERATRLLVDTISALHSELFDFLVSLPDIPSEALSASDSLCDAIVDVRIEGQTTLSIESSDGSSASDKASMMLRLDPQPSFEVGVGSETRRDRQQTVSMSSTGMPVARVSIGATQGAFRRLVESLPIDRLWILLDEWSSLPIDLQPYLADMLRRILFGIPKITVKIAAIEFRSQFRIANGPTDGVGLEVGADIFADLNLDDYMVFSSDTERSSDFFNDLVYRHVRSIVGEDIGKQEFNRLAFTEIRPIKELARAAEGVPRDAINIAGKAAQRVFAQGRAIGMPEIRAAADQWFQQDKNSATNGNPDAQGLLEHIRDEVLGHRQARAFLLRQDLVKHPLIQQLIDSRILHLIRRGYSSQDEAGVRYDVLQIDYGCYVNLMRTTREPQGLFGPSEDGILFEVPPDDMRSIRRAILRLDEIDIRIK